MSVLRERLHDSVSEWVLLSRQTRTWLHSMKTTLCCHKEVARVLTANKLASWEYAKSSQSQSLTVKAPC